MGRHSDCLNLTEGQVERLEERRKKLALSRAGLLQRFEEALRCDGAVHTMASAEKRLDRVLNPRLRRPVSEATLMALASALDWTLPDLEKALKLAATPRHVGLHA